MIVVLDTNVLVSGMINPHGPPGRIVDLLRIGELRLGVDDRILAEYVEVLRRPRLAAYFRTSDVNQIVDYLRGNSVLTMAARVISDLVDGSDAPFLEIAFTLGVPLVTGNMRHFPPDKRAGVSVELPACFLKRFED